MKTISNLAGLIKDRIRVPRKAPQRTVIEGRQAVISKLIKEGPPLAVASTRIFAMEDVITDGTAVSVYLALCAHADKGTGITACGQQRLAYLCKLSVRTVARKLDKLKAAGLIKKEYSRPVGGNPMHRLNIMRIIYDDGSMSRQDVQSIAQPTTGHSHVALSNSVDNSAPINSTIRHPDVALSDNRTSIPPYNQTNGAVTQSDIQLSGNQAKALNNNGQAEQEYTHEDIIKYWRTCAGAARREVIPNEADHETVEKLISQATSLKAIRGAIADHCLDAQERGQPPAVRLQPYVAELLATR